MGLFETATPVVGSGRAGATSAFSSPAGFQIDTALTTTPGSPAASIGRQILSARPFAYHRYSLHPHRPRLDTAPRPQLASHRASSPHTRVSPGHTGDLIHTAARPSLAAQDSAND